MEMNRLSDVLLGIFIGLVIAFCLVFLYNIPLKVNLIKEGIRLEKIQHNPVNGKLEWVDKK